MDIDQEKQERMRRYFLNTNVDYSNFVDSSTDGAHVSRYIRTHIRQGLPLKLTTDHSSNIHMLECKGQTLLYFLSSSSYDIQYENIFIGNEQVVSMPEYSTKMYYVREIIKNILIMDYLTTDSDLYSKYLYSIENDKLFFKEFVARSSLIDDIPFSVNMGRLSITIDYPKRDFNIIVKDNQGEYFSFEYKSKKFAIKKRNFDTFIRSMNKAIFVDTVNKHMEITPMEFTASHRDIVKMLEI
jgi:hypothetical protein